MCSVLLWCPTLYPEYTDSFSICSYPANLWAYLVAPASNNYSALSERLTTDIADIQGVQVALNISNAATRTALQVVNATVSAINARFSITETAASNAATHTALQVVNATVSAINARLNITETAASNAATHTALEVVNTALQVAEFQIANLTTIYGAALNLAQGQIVNLTAALASQKLASQVDLANVTAVVATQILASQAERAQISNLSALLAAQGSDVLNLLTRMAAAEGRLAGSTFLTTSADTPILTIVALALAAVALFVLLMLALVHWFRRSPIGIKNIAMSPTPLATWDTDMYSTAGLTPCRTNRQPWESERISSSK